MPPATKFFSWPQIVAAAIDARLQQFATCEQMLSRADVGDMGPRAQPRLSTGASSRMAERLPTKPKKIPPA
jgi:hypothetical protein